jgi:hypothetical protein
MLMLLILIIILFCSFAPPKIMSTIKIRSRSLSRGALVAALPLREIAARAP